MKCRDWKDLLKDGMIGGLAGIGVSSTIFLVTSGLTPQWRYWIFRAFFGFLVGLLICLGNEVLIPVSKSKNYGVKPLIIYLLLSYVVSTAIFYGVAVLLHDWFYGVFFIPSSTNQFYISLGAGVASVMIAFCFMFVAEKEELLRLEKENKELAIVEERTRIARELHDSVSQNLFGISLHINSLELIAEQNPAKAKDLAKVVREMVEEAQTEMRLMIYELRPTALAEKGFLEAMESMINLFQVRYNLDISSELKGEENLDSRKQNVLYRVLQELLTNIAKHAYASKVKVNLFLNQGKAELLVLDNGKGFEIQAVDEGKHFGLQGIQERIDEVGGECFIESTLGKGTRACIKV